MRRNRYPSQRGGSLLAALFLITVLALLGGAAARLAGVGAQTVTLSVLSARALHAAVSGAEWGAYQALVNGSCTPATLNMNAAGVAGFRVEVSCSSSVFVDGGLTVTSYTIESFAQFGSYGGPDYVSRRVVLKASEEV